MKYVHDFKNQLLKILHTEIIEKHIIKTRKLTFHYSAKQKQCLDSTYNFEFAKYF